MDIGYTTSISIVRIGVAVFLFDSSSSATSVDHDSIFARIFEIFHAKKPYQPDFQASFATHSQAHSKKIINFFFFRRSSQQIYNVTLFFLFFMSLYGLLGVQFFGELKNHCVMNTTTLE